jgi:HAMP domain-containing protein
MGGLLMTKTVRTEQVLRILQGYRCSRWSYDDTGKAMQLTDVLTPNGHETITAGIAELENLADYIAGQLAELPDEPKADPQFPWGVNKDMTYVPTEEFQAMKAELEALRNAVNRNGDA